MVFYQKKKQNYLRYIKVVLYIYIVPKRSETTTLTINLKKKSSRILLVMGLFIYSVLEWKETINISWEKCAFNLAHYYQTGSGKRSLNKLVG